MKFKTPKQKSRERAVQALYQFFISGDDIVDIENQFLEQNKTKISKTFFTLLVRGSVKEKIDLEKLISEFSERKLDEIAPVEKAILYVGLFELKNVHTILLSRLVQSHSIFFLKTQKLTFLARLSLLLTL